MSLLIGFHIYLTVTIRITDLGYWFDTAIIQKVQIGGDFILDILKNPTTVKLLASHLIQACDNYIALKISEKQFKEIVIHYASFHGKKLFGRKGLNPTVVNRIGKRRVDLVSIMLNGFQHSLNF